MNSFVSKFAWTGFVTLAVGLFLFVGCGKDKYNPTKSTYDTGGGQTQPSQNTVIISNFAYSPATITISVGDTIIWRNDDNVGHTVTSDSGSELDSPLLSKGDTYMHVFNTAGSYPYHCTVHPSMKAAVVVQ
jgi:plastocyanin